MKLLRDDLIIYPAEDGSKKFFVKNPATNALYEFGEKEYYLINALKASYNERVLLTRFNATFGEKEPPEFLTDLIELLDGWGLLTDEHGVNASGKEAAKTETNPLPSPLASKRKKLNHWSLFCPEKYLDKVVSNFRFIRYFVVLLPFLFLVAVVGLIANIELYKQDLLQVALTLNFVEHTIYTMFTINLMTVTVKGCIARFFNIETPSFGFMLAYGLIPEFDIQLNFNENIDRKARLWLCSAATLVRIFLFSAGIIVWLIIRQSGTSLTVFSAALAWYSVMTLLIIANPLLNGDGSRFFSIYFKVPDLFPKAHRSLRYLFSPPPAVVAKYAEDNWPLRMYAVLSISFIISVVVFVGFTLGGWLEKNYRGLGIILFIAIIIYLVSRFRRLKKAVNEMRMGIPPENRMSAGKAGEDATRNQKAGGDPSSYIGRIRRVGWLRFFIIVAIVGALFLPYQYEAGGTAVVSPVLHQQIYSESKGIIKKVNFDGGEWLKKGTVIAEMENYRQLKDVELTRSTIDKQREDIALLLTTPTAEEVDLAKQQLTSAKLKFEYGKDEYARMKTLYEEGNISLATYLDIKEKMELAQQEVENGAANLRLIENQVNVHKIESAKMELVLLQRELQFYEEALERTKLRMPSDGMIITMNLKNLENKFLDDGNFFAEIEDSSRIQIEMKIPESDSSNIAVGCNVLFKTPLYPDKAITGKVTSIYPVTEETTFGTVLKVVSVVPNTNGFLKTGMTGYAKIESDKMFAVQAFTKALVSFVLIEFWSWLP